MAEGNLEEREVEMMEGIDEVVRVSVTAPPPSRAESSQSSNSDSSTDHFKVASLLMFSRSPSSLSREEHQQVVHRLESGHPSDQVAHIRSTPIYMYHPPVTLLKLLGV